MHSLARLSSQVGLQQSGNLVFIFAARPAKSDKDIRCEGRVEVDLIQREGAFDRLPGKQDSGKVGPLQIIHELFDRWAIMPNHVEGGASAETDHQDVAVVRLLGEFPECSEAGLGKNTRDIDGV